MNTTYYTTAEKNAIKNALLAYKITVGSSNHPVESEDKYQDICSALSKFNSDIKSAEMNIQNAKMPLVDGETYYLPVIFEGSMEPMTEGGGCFSTPGGHCLMLNKQSVRKLRVEVGKTYRCMDCKHAELSSCNARNVYCEFQHPSSSWDKMCSACEHFEYRKEQQ